MFLDHEPVVFGDEPDANDGIDRVSVQFVSTAAAQLVAADPTVRGYGFIHEIVGEFSSSSEADADAAVAAAAGAFAEWAALPLARRAGYLTAAAAVLEARVEQVAHLL